MRLSLFAMVLGLAGCDIVNEPEQDKVTVTYDEERIKNATETTKRTANQVGTGVVIVTKGAAQVIKREVGDVDVDVKVTRTPSDPAR